MPTDNKSSTTSKFYTTTTTTGDTTSNSTTEDIPTTITTEEEIISTIKQITSIKYKYTSIQTLVKAIPNINVNSKRHLPKTINC